MSTLECGSAAIPFLLILLSRVSCDHRSGRARGAAFHRSGRARGAAFDGVGGGATMTLRERDLGAMPADIAVEHLPTAAACNLTRLARARAARQQAHRPHRALAGARP